MDKPRTIVDYERLPESLTEQIKLVYPYGYSKYLIKFVNKDGETKQALRFETDEKIYLIRMTVSEAKEIVSDDDDFDDEGNLKDAVKEDYEDKYSDLDYLPDPDTEDND